MQDMHTFCPFEDLVFLIAAILDKKKNFSNGILNKDIFERLQPKDL